jgi:hypothetical protein
VRTPKHGIQRKGESWVAKRYRAAKDFVPYVELGLSVYFGVAMVIAARGGHYVSMPFLALFLVGFGYVGLLSVHQTR